jgi:glycosyltransferase involved in cell wall biosynthesis
MTADPRIAFLTPEFPSEERDGGVGSYVSKMVSALADCGVTAEVFVPSRVDERIVHDGTTVHRVCRELDLASRIANKIATKTGGKHGGRLFCSLREAWMLARALERRHADRPFAAVQSANYQLTGFFVRHRADRRHLVRISTSRLLWDAANGETIRRAQRWMEALDVRCMGRADYVYAPSRYLAEYFHTRYRLPVDVLRPALVLPRLTPFTRDPEWPPRFLLHFGLLSDRKGTDLVADALSRALKVDPSLQMVWAGGQKGDYYVDALMRHFPDIQGHVLWVGKLDKPALYSLIDASEAAVLPSRADNLPNTVLETLALKRPVIGFADASLDELVEHGRNGYLVPAGDASALADVIRQFWSHSLVLPKDTTATATEVFRTFSPQYAARALLHAAFPDADRLPSTASVYSCKRTDRSVR